MNFRVAGIAAFCVSSALAANVSKLERQCGEHNLQACNKLKQIATSQKERTSDRIDAIRAISDRQTLHEMGSDPNSDVEAAAAKKLKELDTVDFLSAIDKGDVAAINALAANGVEIDPHSSVLDVEDIQPISGGFAYRFVRRRGASSVMVRAIRSGHPESVQALVALGSDIKSEFFNNDMNIGFSSFASLDYVVHAAELGLPGGISGPGVTLQSNGNGIVTCTVRPQPATKGNYASLAEQIRASSDPSGGECLNRGSATEIHDATRGGDFGEVKTLLTGKPDLVFSKDDTGRTPLHWASYCGRKDVAELLLASNADVNAKDSLGATPLHNAALNGHKDVVELLLASKAEVNAKDNDGWTPLHYAACHGRKGVVELLLASNADVNAKDKDGKTPLHMAVIEDHKDVAGLLSQRGGRDKEF
jgi:ankyrin repeat protein